MLHLVRSNYICRMKNGIRYILILLLCSCALTMRAQSKDFNDVITQIKEGGNKIGMTTLSKEALQLASMFSFNMSDDIKSLLDGMTVLKITKNKTGTTATFFDNSVKAFDEAGYTSIDVSNYVDRNTVRVFGKRRWLSIREAHIITTAERGTNISIFGKFKIRTIRRVMKNNDLRKLF